MGTRRPTSPVRWWLCALLAGASFACGPLSPPDPPVAGGGAGEAGGGAGGGGGDERRGPGPAGALPSGYCCASDADCRQRHCLEAVGGRRCADVCMTQQACSGDLDGLACVGASSSGLGRCLPVAAGAACVPADEYTYGRKAVGQCCSPTWNGANGRECEGGHCVQLGQRPFMCSRACATSADCPGDFDCLDTADGFRLCMPSTFVTSCRE